MRAPTCVHVNWAQKAHGSGAHLNDGQLSFLCFMYWRASTVQPGSGSETERRRAGCTAQAAHTRGRPAHSVGAHTRGGAHAGAARMLGRPVAGKRVSMRNGLKWTVSTGDLLPTLWPVCPPAPHRAQPWGARSHTRPLRTPGSEGSWQNSCPSPIFNLCCRKCSFLLVNL